MVRGTESQKIPMLELIGIIENFLALRVETLQHLLFQYPEVEIWALRRGFWALRLGFLRLYIRINQNFIYTNVYLRRLNIRWKKQVTQGHNIVADGWAGASNPQPNPNPHPSHTNIHKKYPKRLFFHFSTRSLPTDQRMDRQSLSQNFVRATKNNCNILRYLQMHEEDLLGMHGQSPWRFPKFLQVYQSEESHVL